MDVCWKMGEEWQLKDHKWGRLKLEKTLYQERMIIRHESSQQEREKEHT